MRASGVMHDDGWGFKLRKTLRNKKRWLTVILLLPWVGVNLLLGRPQLLGIEVLIGALLMAFLIDKWAGQLSVPQPTPKRQFTLLRVGMRVTEICVLLGLFVHSATPYFHFLVFLATSKMELHRRTQE